MEPAEFVLKYKDLMQGVASIFKLSEAKLKEYEEKDMLDLDLLVPIPEGEAISMRKFIESYNSDLHALANVGEDVAVKFEKALDIISAEERGRLFSDCSEISTLQGFKTAKEVIMGVIQQATPEFLETMKGLTGGLLKDAEQGNGDDLKLTDMQYVQQIVNSELFGKLLYFYTLKRNMAMVMAFYGVKEPEDKWLFE